MLITGASSGIGAACAQAFAASGDHLVLLARRADRLEALKETLLASHDVTIECLVCDVTSREAVANAAQQLPEALACPDILINNAGLAAGLAPIAEAAVDDWERMIDTNIKGLLYVSRTFLPKMIAAKRGHVVNIGSISGSEVYPGGSVYCATKHAVAALTEGLTQELLGTGVRVTQLCPGWVETEFSLVRFKQDAQRAEDLYEGMMPLTAEDVASAVHYCASMPPHVNVAEMLLLPTDQARFGHVHRTTT